MTVGELRERLAGYPDFYGVQLGSPEAEASSRIDEIVQDRCEVFLVPESADGVPRLCTDCRGNLDMEEETLP